MTGPLGPDLLEHGDLLPGPCMVSRSPPMNRATCEALVNSTALPAISPKVTSRVMRTEVERQSP